MPFPFENLPPTPPGGPQPIGIIDAHALMGLAPHAYGHPAARHAYYDETATRVLIVALIAMHDGTVRWLPRDQL